MYEWKMPLKYWGMLLYLSGPLGLGRAADTMVSVSGAVPVKWREQKNYEHIHTGAT